MIRVLRILENLAGFLVQSVQDAMGKDLCQDAFQDLNLARDLLSQAKRSIVSAREREISHRVDEKKKG